jgi:hypothetical protein
MLGIVARISVDVANVHATGFQNTTALVDIDEWLDSLSNKEQEKVLKHYKKMLGSLQQRTLFRATESGSSTTQRLSRCALVADEMMNGLDAAMKASDMFLTTTGGNNRRLLARICCTPAQVSGKLLQPLHHKAWGLAAVAAWLPIQPISIHLTNYPLVINTAINQTRHWKWRIKHVRFLNLKRLGPRVSDSPC